MFTTRWLAVLLLLVAAAAPALAVKRVNVKQLDQALADAAKKPDLEVARWLYGQELTERVSADRLARWKAAMPGGQSRRALMAVADFSAFLNLPSDNVSKDAAPDAQKQREILALGSAYIEKTLAKLPNFFAQQSITTFEDTPAERDGGSFTPYQPLHYADYKTATVLYRNGSEVMETHAGEKKVEDGQIFSPQSGLLSSGEFGPVLKTVLSDAQLGKLTWAYWEMSNATGAEASGAERVAVFRYTVPKAKSHYRVKVELPGHATAFQVRPQYRGEIAIDPETGTVVRLMLRAEMTDEDPLERADLMVEYGTVEIGQKSYICPVRSVAVVAAFQQFTAVGGGLNEPGHVSSSSGREAVVQTMLNDVAFGQYQVLRSEARILTGADLNDHGPADGPAPH